MNFAEALGGVSACADRLEADRQQAEKLVVEFLETWEVIIGPMWENLPTALRKPVPIMHMHYDWWIVLARGSDGPAVLCEERTHEYDSARSPVVGVPDKRFVRGSLSPGAISRSCLRENAPRIFEGILRAIPVFVDAIRVYVGEYETALDVFARALHQPELQTEVALRKLSR